MSVSLQKGQKVSLSKDNQGLAQVIVGLGWDEVKRKGGLFSRKPQAIVRKRGPGLFWKSSS